MVNSERIQEMAKKAVRREHDNQRMSKSSIVAMICVILFYTMWSPLSPIIFRFLDKASIGPDMFGLILLGLGAMFGLYSMTRLYRGGGLIGAIAALICGYNLFLFFSV